MGTARAITDCPNVGCRGLQPLVDFDVAPVSDFDAGQFQTDAFGVGRPSGRDQQMRASENFSAPASFR